MNIVVTNRDTCKNANVPVEDIVLIEEFKEEIRNRTYPYTRIHIKNAKMGHEYTLDVVESEKWIRQLIKEAKEAENERKNRNTEEDIA